MLPVGQTYGEVAKALSAVAPPAPVHIEPTDRYEGPPLAPGEASLTIRLTLQPSGRALTESEIESYRRAAVDTLARDLGLRIRE